MKWLEKEESWTREKGSNENAFGIEKGIREKRKIRERLTLRFYLSH